MFCRQPLLIARPTAALIGVILVVGSTTAFAANDEFFERRIRPLLSAKCFQCHGPMKRESGLRLDTAEGFREGGDAGAVFDPDDKGASRLLVAVRQTTDLKMPPDSKLTAAEIGDLEKWIADGAVWPDAMPVKQNVSASDGTKSLAPDASPLAKSLQLWLKADAMTLPDGRDVPVWPDQSGQGRDFSATLGIRANGSGQPPKFVQRSRINGRPALRFQSATGIAASPDNRLPIEGDAAVTIFIVCQLDSISSQPPYGNLLMIGNAAAPANPNKPLAIYLEVDRSKPAQQLDVAGGWAHDARVGAGSMDLLYREPRLLTVAKAPGPLAKTTRVFFEGRPSSSLLGQPLTGSQQVPDVQHRTDMGVSIGRAANWMGAIQGDIAEVVIYNRLLTDAERRGVESHLLGKYGLLTEAMLGEAKREFSQQERSHWSFQSVVDSPTPSDGEDQWSTSPLDRFIHQKLKANQLQPAPPATRRALIRRVTYDLLGLPPTPEEIDAFLQDPATDADAFARVVDRLLESPHYGERWGRHWLDAVRYADTTANDGNFVMRYAYRYRDYVVDSFNSDKPYDEFLTEQLAGDLLESKDAASALERTIATGFLMIGPKALAETDKEQVKMDIVDEQLDVIGRAMIGMTVACARCHDHKFDPIPTVDYYSMAGILRSTEMFSDLQRNASKWMEFSLPTGTGDETIMVMAPKEGAPRHLQVHQRGSRFRLGQLAPRRFLQVLAGSGHDPIKSASSGRLELARWIAAKDHPLTARVMVNRIWQGHFGTGLVATSDDFGVRGERPSHPELLDWLATRFVESGWSVKALHQLILNSSTYRMSAIAEPSMQSRAMRLDPDNRFLWKSPRRRLDAEQVRDSLLAVSGQLERTIGGGEMIDKLYNSAEQLDKKRSVASASTINSRWSGFDSNRRSIYLPVVRNGLPDALAVFDAADANAVTAKRNETTVPSQAAFLLNNPFSIRQAEAFATRVRDEAKDDRERVRRAYAIALGRETNAEEEAAAVEFVHDYADELVRSGAKQPAAEAKAWSRFCQLLFCLNEFLYVE